MTAPDLTPAEARAEVEAFLGDGWAVITSYVVDDGDLHVVAERDGVCLDAYGPHECAAAIRARGDATHSAADAASED